MGVARRHELDDATPPETQMQFRYCSGKQVTARMEASTTHLLRWTVKELRAGRRQHQYTSPLLLLLLLLLSFQFTNHHFNHTTTTQALPHRHTKLLLLVRQPCLASCTACLSAMAARYSTPLPHLLSALQPTSPFIVCNSCAAGQPHNVSIKPDQRESAFDVVLGVVLLHLSTPRSNHDHPPIVRVSRYVHTVHKMMRAENIVVHAGKPVGLVSDMSQVSAT